MFWGSLSPSSLICWRVGSSLISSLSLPLMVAVLRPSFEVGAFHCSVAWVATFEACYVASIGRSVHLPICQLCWEVQLCQTSWCWRLCILWWSTRGCRPFRYWAWGNAALWHHCRLVCAHLYCWLTESQLWGARCYCGCVVSSSHPYIIVGCFLDHVGCLT